MSGSIVSALSRFLTPDLISKMASVAGISDAARARNAVAAAAAAILSGMANLASKPGGAQALADAIAQQPPHMLDTLSSAAGALGQLADVGQDVLASLFGRGPFSSLTRAIGKYAGLGNGPVNSVLGMLTPAILGVLGREARVGPTALKQLLSAQKDQIARLLADTQAEPTREEEPSRAKQAKR